MRYIYTIMILSLLCQCKKALTPYDYVRWIKDKENGLLLEQKNEFYKSTLQYCPSDYMALISANGEVDFLNEFKKRKRDFNSSYNFVLKLVNEKSSDLLKYKLTKKDEEFMRIKYFSEEIQMDLFMVSNKDTIPCSLSLYERTYNTSPGLTINLNFERLKEGNLPQKIVWIDRVFSNKIVDFNVSEIFKKELPKIKI